MHIMYHSHVNFSVLYSQVNAHNGSVNDIAFSSLNKQLLVITCGDDKTIKVNSYDKLSFIKKLNQGPHPQKKKTNQISFLLLLRSGMLLMVSNVILLKVTKLLFVLFVLIRSKMLM